MIEGESDRLSRVEALLEVQQRQIDDLTAPMVHLKEAARILDKAATAFADVKDRPGFKRADFEAAVREYERAAAAFQSAVSPSEESGD